MSSFRIPYKLISYFYDSLENRESDVIKYQNLFFDYCKYVQKYKQDEKKVCYYFINNEKYILIKFKCISKLIDYSINKHSLSNYNVIFKEFLENANLFSDLFDVSNIRKLENYYVVSLKYSIFDTEFNRCKNFTNNFQQILAKTTENIMHRAFVFFYYNTQNRIDIQKFLHIIDWKTIDARKCRVKYTINKILTQLKNVNFIDDYLIKEKNFFLL